MSNTPQDANEQVEAFAALVGSTQSALHQLDENIVGEAGNLKRTSFDGKEVLKGHIQNVRGKLGPQAMPVEPSPSVGPPPMNHQAPPPSQPLLQNYSQPVQQPAVQPMYGSELTIILQKLVSIENELKGLNERLDNIEYFDKKVVDSLTRGLNNKVKQVTIKLDDINSNQQK
tara:strand:- start:1967 stop:2482 length:516 start_codon:yes stop_codon:yes gene_type:complete